MKMFITFQSTPCCPSKNDTVVKNVTEMSDLSGYEYHSTT